MPEVPSVTLAELSVQVRPEEGDTAAASVTVPVKPRAGAIVIVELPIVPASTVTEVGLAVTVKSFTV